MNRENPLANLPTLETKRLLLRKLEWTDANDIFAFTSDPEVAKYSSWEVNQSLEDAQAYLVRVLERYQAREPGPWGIVQKADSKLIGTVTFHSWELHDQRAELGYVLARPCWGHGYMAEAVRAVLDFGFQKLGLNRVQAMCVVPNTGSARVMEKVGMRFEGLLREYVFEKGQHQDLKLYALLRSEWRNSRVRGQGSGVRGTSSSG